MLDKPTRVLGTPSWRNSATAARFLQALRPFGPWCVTAIYADDSQRIGGDNGPAPTRTFTDPAELEHWIKARNGRANLHFTAQPLQRPMNRKPSEADLAAIEFALTDIDCDKTVPEGADVVKAIENGKTAARQRLEDFELAPTFIIDSGGGLQALWRLEKPIPVEGMEQAKAINRALVATLDGDTQVINPGHLLRLPGTVNIPNQKKAGRGRVPAPTTLLAENSACWPVSSFDTQSISENAPKPKLTIEPTLVDGLEDLEQFYLPERLVQIIEHGRVPGESKEADDSRSAWLFDLVCGLVRRRVPNDIIAGVMLNPDFAISESVLEREDHDQHRYVVHSIENAHKVVKDSRLAAARRDFDDVDDEVLEKLAAADEAATARNVDSNEPDNRPEKPHRFKLYTLAELGALPPVQWLVDGLVVERGLTLIYGPTKQFKTFISIAMALSIATGRDFYGLPVKRGQVVYVIGEGQSDFYNRAKAWCIANDVDLEDLTDWFRVVINPVYVDEEVVVEEFVKVAEEAAPFDAVFVDTLNRNMSGDENSTADMSRFIKGCGVVQRRFRAAVIPIHHTGHNESRSRGSSSLVAAVDASLRVSRVDKKSKLTRLLAEHVRAGPNGLELFFEPESITTDINSTRDTLVMKQVDPPRKDGDQSDGGLNWSTADKVLVEIANLKPTTQAILVRDVRGRSQQNISKIVKALQDEGFLQEGSLALTEAGAAKAKELNRQRHEAAVADFPDDLPEVAEDEEND